MKTDVLVIGGGLAGIAAADAVARGSGLSVTLLQCGGGASPFIHAFCMPVGEGDSEELFLKDTMDSGYGQSDPALARRLCGGAADLMAYFRELGYDLDRENGEYRLMQSLGSSVPRIAGIRNSTGPSMLSALRKRLKETGRYTELTGLRAVELVKENGRVRGARCFDGECFRTLSAGAVVLASGGFGRLFPETTNSGDLGGDGIAMAFRAGAALTDMEFIQFEPSAAVWPEQVRGKGIVTTMFYDGAVLRGADGRRFMAEHGENAERVSKDVLSKCIYREIRENGGTPHGGVWFDATAVPEEKWRGQYRPYLERYLACGIDLRETPVEIAPAAHTTCGGVRIDGCCRTGVPGLIACGEVTGGLHGANRLGGNAGLETMVFGRIAGETAAADCAPAAPLPEDVCAGDAPDTDADAMRMRLGEILRGSLNVIRSGEGLRHGLEQLEEMLCGIGEFRNCFEKYRLVNDLLTAKAAMLSALERRGSIGCHCRADSADESRCRIEIRNDGGRMRVLRGEI